MQSQRRSLPATDFTSLGAYGGVQSDNVRDESGRIVKQWPSPQGTFDSEKRKLSLPKCIRPSVVLISKLNTYMSKFMNGSIVSIDEEIVSDIEMLVSFAHSELDGTGSVILDSADRVREYINTYKSTEEDVI